MYARIAAPSGAGWLDSVLREADGFTVAPDPSNPAWRAYRAWLAEGNEPREPPPAVGPPRTIEGRLLIKALTDEQAGLVKPRDLLRIAGDQAIPEANGAVTRVAGKLGLGVPAWFDAAAAP